MAELHTMSLPGALDTRYTVDDITERPFAVRTGYEPWGEVASHIASDLAKPIFEDEAEGLLSPEEVQKGIVFAQRAICRSSELGYQSRLSRTPNVVAGWQLDPDTASSLGEGYERWDGNLKNKERALWNPDSPRPLLKLVALSGLRGLVPDASRQAFLWGRTDSLHFLAQH